MRDGYGLKYPLDTRLTADLHSQPYTVYSNCQSTQLICAVFVEILDASPGVQAFKAQ